MKVLKVHYKILFLSNRTEAFWQQNGLNIYIERVIMACRHVLSIKCLVIDSDEFKEFGKIAFSNP